MREQLETVGQGVVCGLARARRMARCAGSRGDVQPCMRACSAPSRVGRGSVVVLRTSAELSCSKSVPVRAVSALSPSRRRTALDSARTYPRAAASTMSVETPCPDPVEAPDLDHDRSLAERVLSPGHRPDVEFAQTRVNPVAVLIARKIASIGPSPPNEPSSSSPSGPADTDLRVRRAPRRGLNVKPLERVADSGLLTQLVCDSASRSIALTCFFLSAISLKRLKAVLSAWPLTSMPSSPAPAAGRGDRSACPGPAGWTRGRRRPRP